MITIRNTTIALLALLLCSCGSESDTSTPSGAGAGGAGAGGSSPGGTGGSGGTSDGGGAAGSGGALDAGSAGMGDTGGSGGSSAAGGASGAGGSGAAGAAGQPSPDAGPPPSEFKVIGYQASWSGDVAQLPYARLTHINYSFLLPTSDGGFSAVENPGKLSDLVSLGHAAGVKVLIAVGGWNDGNDSAFETIAVNPSLRQTFVDNLVTFANDYDLDGIDIDWEYPDEGASGDGFTALMAELSAQLHASGKLLTAAVTGSSWGASGVSTEVFGYVDWLNLMAYDGGSGADHSPYSYAESALAYWVGRGLPSDKAMIGVPFYSRPGWRTYRSLVDQYPDAPYHDTIDGEWYNGIDTIRAKTRLALDHAGGVMIWELSQDTSDDTSLLKAIDDEVHGL